MDFQMYTMALRLSALAEQNMNRILNTWNNLNKKGGKKKHRRKLLMSDDENASVSEYEPPGVKKFPKKKRQLPDDEDPSTSKTKSSKFAYCHSFHSE
ncbi:hypothetical protein J6590_068362 [Homalodisca vitripennis]|nr:hypothetical protein J6590_068362 [Homalodisca vitripennis]